MYKKDRNIAYQHGTQSYPAGMLRNKIGTCNRIQTNLQDKIHHTQTLVQKSLSVKAEWTVDSEAVETAHPRAFVQHSCGHQMAFPPFQRSPYPSLSA